MARYNELLVGRYNRFVQKLFSMKGPASLSTVSDEMMPVLPLFHGSENRYLEGWNRFGQDTNPTIQAAAKSGTRLRNPSGSNLILVVEKITVSLWSAADTPFLQVAAVATDLDFIFNTANARFDPRGNPNPSATLSTTSAAGVGSIGGTKLQWNQATLSNFDPIVTFMQEFPVLPGDACQVSGNTNNTTGHVAFWWRERFLEESERT